MQYMNKSPYYQVSVLMAVKNESLYLKDSLLSISRQSNVNIQIILVDDHSTDNTYQIAVDLLTQIPGLFVYSNPGSGKVDAYNFAYSLATSDYVCFFAGDDIMPNDSMYERLLPLIGFDHSLRVASICKIRILSSNKSLNGKLIPKAKGKANLSGQSPLFSRSLANQIFPIPNCLPNEDHWTYAFMTYCPIDYLITLDTICCDWRLHSGNSYDRNSSCREYRSHLIPRYGAYEELYRYRKHLLSDSSAIGLKNHIRLIDSYINQNLFSFFFSPVPFSQKVTLLRSFNALFFSLFKILDKLR